MKIYRVALYDYEMVSKGYSWRGNKADAEREAREHIGVAEIEEIEVMTTKLGILRALNNYASKPQNG